MPKISLSARNLKRLMQINKFKQIRADLKKNKDYLGLIKLGKKASPVCYRNRCTICARGNAYMRKFGLCRICFRNKASNGELPGVKKASW